MHGAKQRAENGADEEPGGGYDQRDLDAGKYKQIRIARD